MSVFVIFTIPCVHPKGKTGLLDRDRIACIPFDIGSHNEKEREIQDSPKMDRGVQGGEAKTSWFSVYECGSVNCESSV